MAKLARVPDEFVTIEGFFRTERFPDANLFCINSIAAAAGSRDPHYFETRVLTDPSSIFHAHKVRLCDEVTGRLSATVYATHQNSAEAGGQMWREFQRRSAQARGHAAFYATQSGHLLAPWP